MEYECKSRIQVIFTYGCASSPFGQIFVVLRRRSFVHLSFIDTPGCERRRLAFAAACLKTFYPFARFVEENIQESVDHAFGIYMQGKFLPSVELVGPPFYERVWTAVTRIGFGKTALYEDIARNTGFKSSPRSCAQIIALNPVACFIPCHRIISRSGDWNLYRWGKERQKDLLTFETQKSQEIIRRREESPPPCP